MPPAGNAEASNRRNGQGFLEHDLRRRIFETIQAHPGTSEADLVRRLHVSRGVIKYHLGRLQGAGLIHGASHGRTNRYSTDAAGNPLQTVLAAAEGGTRRRLLFHLYKVPNITTAELAHRLDVRPRTVRWHLQRLEEQGLVAVDPQQPDHLYLHNRLLAVLLGDPALMPDEELPEELRSPPAFRRVLRDLPWSVRETRAWDTDEADEP